MKKILLTCFEPFGGETVNPSALAVEAVTLSSDFNVIKLPLPVCWHTAPSLLRQAISDNKPDVVLSIGQAGGSSAIRLERVAINLCGAVRDNDGFFAGTDREKACECPIAEQAPAAFFSTVDFPRLLPLLQNAGIPATLSYSAGTYLCNAVLYTALYEAEKAGNKMLAGFMHVPYAQGQKEDRYPSMAVSDMAKAIEIVLKNL